MEFNIKGEKEYREGKIGVNPIEVGK